MITLQNAQEIINEAIHSIHYEKEPRQLYAPMQYILGLGGKRIRPSLTVLACNVFSDRIENSVSAAIALEVFHNFTLVHDDIMDNANLRRGEPTVHANWDANTAILSGDGMCIKAYEILCQCDEKYLKSILQVFNRTALEVCEGQQFDMNFELLDHVSEAQYIRMISLKTSVLLAACLKIGAITGDSSTLDAERMYQFGYNMGLAFQLQDDLLDVYGQESSFGKEIGKDIVANKKTYLLIKALEMADIKQKAELVHWLSKVDFEREAKITAITYIYNELKIKEATILAIDSYFNEAQQNLESVEVPDERKLELKKFLMQIRKREY